MLEVLGYITVISLAVYGAGSLLFEGFDKLEERDKKRAEEKGDQERRLGRIESDISRQMYFENEADRQLKRHESQISHQSQALARTKERLDLIEQVFGNELKHHEEVTKERAEEERKQELADREKKKAEELAQREKDAEHTKNAEPGCMCEVCIKRREFEEKHRQQVEDQARYMSEKIRRDRDLYRQVFPWYG